jgi:mannose-6-phosphate isomerase-like protein (cupin superfamily)
VKGPAGVLCRTGHSHAIYNPGPTPVQWMNLNVSLVPGVYDNFDLGDTRVGAALDAIPAFMTFRLERSQLRASARGRGAAAPAAAPDATLSRRVAGPAVFSTTWSYLDHVLVPPGAATPEVRHDALAEAYYVLGGEGTISITGGESGTALVRAGDAIPVRLRESSRFTNTGSAPFELFVIGVAKDAATKTQLLTNAER